MCLYVYFFDYLFFILFVFFGLSFSYFYFIILNFTYFTLIIFKVKFISICIHVRPINKFKKFYIIIFKRLHLCHLWPLWCLYQIIKLSNKSRDVLNKPPWLHLILFQRFKRGCNVNMSDKEEGRSRRVETTPKMNLFKFVKVGCISTNIQLWGHNKRCSNSKIGLRITSKLPCSKNLGCPFNPVKKVNIFMV